jgi:hypothetical protein
VATQTVAEYEREKTIAAFRTMAKFFAKWLETPLFDAAADEACDSDTADAPCEGYDEIKKPKHYTQGIECWDYSTSQGLGFLEGNVVKYVTRWRRKDGIKDLYKARAYLNRAIAEAEKEGYDGRPL